MSRHPGLNSSKEMLIAKADAIFGDIREELASLLDNTIETSEWQIKSDLWYDFSIGLQYSLTTLASYAHQLEALSGQWQEVENLEVANSLPEE